uniref:Uncharacterized protein n=1 Tax=Tanacetum cinerariifolium TaxID=118510 RepID=A0A6L2MB43_TANCI|nr:hypothetical protein [Tanacetum cinerariifolium]
MVVFLLSNSIRAMDPNSSLEKICLGDHVVVISSDKDGNGRDQKTIIAPCFVNGLEVYDGVVILEFDENLISNEYAVKLCLDYEEDDSKHGVILGRSFLRLAHGVVDFDNGVITIYPELDPFEDDYVKIGKGSDDWDQLLDFNFDDVPKFGEELPLFICKMGKSNCNKKRTIENLNLFYQDIGPSSSAGGHLTQEEAEKKALAVRISQKFALLEEEKHAIETMAYNDKYKKILDEIWKDMVELDGKIVKEEEDAVRGEGREEMKKINKGFTMINHTQAEAIGKLSNVLCQVGVTTLISKFLILDIPIDRDAPVVVGQGFLYTMGSVLNTPDRLLSTLTGSVINLSEPQDDMLRIRLHEAGSDEEIFTSVAWIRAFNINEPIYAELFHEFYSTYEFNEIISKLARKCRVLTEDVVRSLSGLIYCRDLDTTTLRDLIDFDGKLIQEDPQSSVPRVGIPRPPRESV